MLGAAGATSAGSGGLQGSLGGDAAAGSLLSGAAGDGDGGDAGAPAPSDAGASPGGAGLGGASSAGAGGSPEPNIPLDSLYLWLRADRGVHLVDGAVDVWADQSGGGRDAFKNIASQRPKLSATAWNGLPVLEFDGADDDLALPEGFSDFSAGLTFFASVSQEADSDCSAVLQLSNGAEIDDVDFSRVNASLSYEVIEQTVEGVHGAYALDQRVLLGVVSRPNETVDLRINGEFTNGAQGYLVPSPKTRSKNFVGRSLYASCSPFGGKIAEILLYTRALSATEVSQVEGYLRQKWGCCE